MDFTNITYSSEKFQSILSRNIKNDDYNIFLNLINKPYISLSGSSILELISNEDWKSNDLDIYISLSKINDIHDLKDLLYYLLSNYENDYTYSTKYSINEALELIISTLEKKVYNNITLNPAYTTEILNNYLKFYLDFLNENQKIELIFISCDIKTLLLNTFDYDIVKNYWSENKVYTYNYYNIQNKIACMTLKHFITIILKNEKIFDHFLKRYLKYTKRGYKLFIHKTLLTANLINNIYNIKYNIKQSVNYELYYKNHITYDNKANEIYFPKQYKIFDIELKCEYIDLKFIYSEKNKNQKLSDITVEKNGYIIKLLLFAGVFNKYKCIKNLLQFNNNLIEEYFNPNSLFIQNKFQNNEKNNKGIYYITNTNKLKLIKID